MRRMGRGIRTETRGCEQDNGNRTMQWSSVAWSSYRADDVLEARCSEEAFEHGGSYVR